MACPYFIPEELCGSELWPHRQRLPLGDGFAGRCGALDGEARCADERLRECNLGYATCPHLPAAREFDCIRFRVCDDDGKLLRVQFVCEREHRPARHGELAYDLAASCWPQPPEAALARLAEAAVRAWMTRHAEKVATV
jgi:hypothetical protein